VQPRLVGAPPNLLIGGHRVIVDPDRRVTVRVRAGAATNPHAVGAVGACDYTIVAAVPPKGGGTQP
jgi:hypothetical protein